MDKPTRAEAAQLANALHHFCWKLPIKAQHHDSPD
jgi:hypothetical protein